MGRKGALFQFLVFAKGESNKICMLFLSIWKKHSWVLEIMRPDWLIDVQKHAPRGIDRLFFVDQENVLPLKFSNP